MRFQASVMAGFGLALAVARPALLPAQAPQGPIVYVVAPSPSTDKEAHRIMRFCRWSDTTLARDADMILVVVRSSGGAPLAPAYDSLKWLRDEASGQLNESGAQFHAYLYTMRRDEHLTEANHSSYDAEEGNGRLVGPRIPFGRCGLSCGCF